MDGGKTWYLCDSEKNTERRRTAQEVAQQLTGTD